MITNVKSLRTESNDILYCFQCLYQNKLISTAKKNELVQLFRECLSEEEYCGTKRKLYKQLQIIFCDPDLPMTFKQQIEKIMDVLS